MIQELAEYEKCPKGPTITIENLEEDGFCAQPYFKCYVAEKEGKVVPTTFTLLIKYSSFQLVGFSLFSYVYYTWVGKSIYLDDLYVKPEERGKGIGIKVRTH